MMDYIIYRKEDIMATVYIDHPLITHKLAIMRDQNTSSQEFNTLLKEITVLAAYELTKDFPVKEVSVTTPLQETTTTKLAQGITLVPILRAGLGFLEGMKMVLPQAKVGHIVMKRDEETLEAKEFYSNMPSSLSSDLVIVLDPMLATGASLSKALDTIKQHGAKHIRYLSLLAAPEGVQLIEKNHPDVDMYICALDEKLNEHGYILPGLGDAGDRLFATE